MERGYQKITTNEKGEGIYVDSNEKLYVEKDRSYLVLM